MNSSSVVIITWYIMQVYRYALEIILFYKQLLNICHFQTLSCILPNCTWINRCSLILEFINFLLKFFLKSTCISIDTTLERLNSLVYKFFFLLAKIYLTFWLRLCDRFYFKSLRLISLGFLRSVPAPIFSAYSIFSLLHNSWWIPHPSQ